MWLILLYVILCFSVCFIVPLCCIVVRIRSKRLAKLFPREENHITGQCQRERNRLAAEADIRAREWALQLMLERMNAGANNSVIYLCLFFFFFSKVLDK